MHFRQEFDDLDDLVVELRGRIGRDGMLLSTDEPYSVGTVLELDIFLTGEEPLVRGTAGVIRLLESRSNRARRHLAVLEFMELDAASEAFVGRLVARFEAEGAEVFRLDRYVRRGRRGVSAGDAAGTASGTAGAAPPPALSEPTEQTLDAHGMTRHRPGGSSRRRWALAAMLGTAMVTVATIQVYHLLSSPPLPAIDPGPFLGAVVGTPPDQVTSPPPDAAAPAPTREHRATQVAPPGPGAALPPATRIERITWSRASGATVVTLEADGVMDRGTISYGRIDDRPRPRLALYLDDVAAGDLAYRTAVGGPRLEAIRVWYHADASPARLHVVLDLAGPEVTASAPVLDGRRLVVTLGPPSREAAPGPAAATAQGPG